MIAYLALVIALGGLLMFVLATNQKLVEIGKILFFCGVLGTVLKLAERSVRLF